MIRSFCRRYRFFLALGLVNTLLLFLAPETGWKALTLTRDNLLEMLSFLPPIFTRILIG